MNFIVMLSILFSSFAISQSPMAGEESPQSCNKYDYYDKGNDFYNQPNVTHKKNDSELSPVRDQDSIGWCYSYTAADLYEQWIKDKNIVTDNSKSISPMGIAIGYETNDERDDNRDTFTDLKNYNEQRTRSDRNIATKREEISKMQSKADLLNGKLDYREHTLISEDVDASRINEDLQKLRRALASPNPETNRDVFEKHGIEIQEHIPIPQHIQEQMGIDNNLFPQHILEAISKLDSLKNQLSSKVSLLISNDEEAKKLLADLTELDRNINQATQDLNQILSESRIIQPTDFPAGGYPTRAIMTAYYDDYMCFEDEFNSRNLQLRELVQQYTDDYQYLHQFNSSNIKEIMKELYRLNGNGQYMEYCSKDLFLRALFPSLKGDLSNLIENLNSEQHFYEYYRTLIGQACTELDSLEIPIPELVYDYAGTIDYPINSIETANDRVFEILDEAIANGRIAEISYLSSILKNDDGTGHVVSKHSSVITGKTSICGEDYYILRNSWGQGACENNFRSFKSSQEEDPSFKATYDACVEATDEAWSKDVLQCGNDIECQKRVDDAHDVAYLACVKEFFSKRNERIKMPYFCDGDGNYIISKDHLKTGVYAASYISN